MNITRKNLVVLVGMFLLITIACRALLGGGQPDEADINAEMTLQAISRTQTALAQPAPAEEEPPAEESAPDEDAGEDAPEPEEEEDGIDDCYRSRFVSETIPDGSEYDPGDAFTKQWVIRNDGTCDWNTGFRFNFEEGDQLGGQSSMQLAHSVEPGDTYTFEVDLEAPPDAGDYTGVWRLKSDDGFNLGKYWVKITVGAPAPPPSTFAVTSVSYYMPHTTIDMGCPGDVSISAEITTSEGGVVSYKWKDSEGCPGCVTKSTNFAGAESKIIQHTMTITATGDHWARIYIDEPNHQSFAKKEFHVNCTP